MPYPGLLHPEPLPLQQSTADLYVCRRHQRNISCKDGHNKGQKWQGSSSSRSRRDAKNIQKNYTTKVLMTQITTMVWYWKTCFHSNPKERQCQRMFKLPQNCTHRTGYQSNAQNAPIQASTVHEMRTSRCTSWIYKRQRNHRSNCQHPTDHRKSKRISKKHLLQ